MKFRRSGTLNNFRIILREGEDGMSSLRNLVCTGVPSIAQLVERRTVEVKLTSLGRWFKSGSKELLFSFNSIYSISSFHSFIFFYATPKEL